MTIPATKQSILRVTNALREQGVTAEIIEFAQSTRTAQEAATAIGTDVAHIVKSLVFVAGESPILALMSGANRVSTERLAEALDQPIRRADAAAVRAATGFAIGGVAPIGHETTIPVVMDADLLQYDTVYAAAGTPNTVFPITPQELVRITNTQVLVLKEAPNLHD